MTNYLLDTNILSELRKPQTVRNPHVVAWFSTVGTGHLYTSSISIFEIEYGIALKSRTDPKQGEILRRWFHRLRKQLQFRCIYFNEEAASYAATFNVPDPKDQLDSFIAGIAAANGMTIATRNTKHFASIPVPIVNPFEFEA
ncbi:MAG: type II toxin-antitoxin system VapC family toxin [Corynebacterium sp.]|nr:type II toxin-antitoxin system VapC family toxin [Corynebacterium sp.]